MNSSELLRILINKFKPIENWRNNLNEGFPSKESSFNSVKIETFIVKNDINTYKYPNRIVLLNEIIYNKDTIKIEHFTTIDKIPWRLNISCDIYPLVFIEHIDEYNGGMGDLLYNLVKSYNIGDKYAYSTEELFPYNDGLLYFLDSSLGWSSQLLIFTDKELGDYGTDSKEVTKLPMVIQDILHKYGINYPPIKTLEQVTYLLLPRYFAKIVHERIEPKGDTDILNVVIQKSMFTLWRHGDNILEISYQLRDPQKQIIGEGKQALKGNGEYLSLEIVPHVPGQIAWSKLNLLLNGVAVDNSEGYFVRSVNIDVKQKSKNG